MRINSLQRYIFFLKLPKIIAKIFPLAVTGYRLLVIIAISSAISFNATHSLRLMCRLPAS